MMSFTVISLMPTERVFSVQVCTRDIGGSAEGTLRKQLSYLIVMFYVYIVCQNTLSRVILMILVKLLNSATLVINMHLLNTLKKQSPDTNCFTEIYVSYI